MNSPSDHISVEKDRLPPRKSILTRVVVIVAALVILPSACYAYFWGLPAWFHDRGTRHLEAQEYDEAIEQFTWAANLLLYDEHWLRMRGFAYRKIGDYDKAIADYNKAISLDPNDAIAYNYRGVVYIHKYDYDRAIADYNKAIELDPDYALAQDNLRIAQDEKRWYESALADYDKAISVQPDSAHIYYGRGLVHLYLGNDAEARQDLLKALELGEKKHLIENALKYLSHSP